MSLSIRDASIEKTSFRELHIFNASNEVRKMEVESDIEMQVGSFIKIKTKFMLTI